MPKDLNRYRYAQLPKTVKSINDLTLTDSQRLFLQHYVKCNLITHHALKSAKIGAATFYIWREEFPHFRKALDLFRDRFVDVIESKFAELVNEGNPQAVMFGLKTLGRNRGYAEKQEVEHTLSGINVSFNEPEKLEDKSE